MFEGGVAARCGCRAPQGGDNTQGGASELRGEATAPQGKIDFRVRQPWGPCVLSFEGAETPQEVTVGLFMVSQLNTSGVPAPDRGRSQR